MSYYNPYKHKPTDKLVRDRIPELMRKEGKMAIIKEVKDDKEYYNRLLEKLQEEINEFIETPNIEEAADILEVFNALMEFNNIDVDNVINERIKKFLLKGGFEKRIVLREIKKL